LAKHADGSVEPAGIEADVSSGEPAEPVPVGRASFMVAADVAPPTPLLTGRASFGIGVDPVTPPTPEPRFKIRQPEQPLGRASFLLPDDVPPTSDAEPEGLDYPPNPGPSDTG
jgi:hypothetical protein